MYTGSAHAVMGIYNPGREISLNIYCKNQEMKIALSKVNYLPSNTCAISTNNLPTFLVSSDPGCEVCLLFSWYEYSWL